MKACDECGHFDEVQYFRENDDDPLRCPNCGAGETSIFDSEEL